MWGASTGQITPSQEASLSGSCQEGGVRALYIPAPQALLCLSLCFGLSLFSSRFTRYSSQFRLVCTRICLCSAQVSSAFPCDSHVCSVAVRSSQTTVSFIRCVFFVFLLFQAVAGAVARRK